MNAYARLLLLIFLALGAKSVIAQEISFTATVDRNTIAAGEHVRLTLTLVNSKDRFEAPDLGGMVVVQGPWESSAFNYVNRRMTSSVSHTWVLTATGPGKYAIGKARVRVGGGFIQTEPITIEVTKGTAKPADPNLAQGQRADPNLFITINLDRAKAYVGEQVVATYTLYTRYSSVELSKFELPKLNGFWAEEIDIGEAGWQDELKVVNGVPYKVAVLKKQLLFPQRAGKLLIEPMELTCIVNRSIFNRGSSVSARSNAVDLNAVALPAGAPPDFAGAVGELQLLVQADRTSVKANEAIEILVRISGRSNLKLLDPPALTFPDDMESYAPKVVDRITVNAGGMGGSREFQYTVIPRHEGRYDLGMVSLSYFDPRSATYKTLSAPPLVLDVAQGDGGPTTSMQRHVKSDVVTLGEDVRYIHEGDLGLRPKGRFLFGSLPWAAGMATPAVAFVLFLGWRRKRELERSDVDGTRRKRADGVARKRLQAAEAALKQGEREAFYTALSQALNGYLIDKFALGVAEVDGTVLRQRFTVFKNGDELADQCARLLSACNMARFAPVEDRSRNELYEEASQVIQRIEQAARA